MDEMVDGILADRWASHLAAMHATAPAVSRPPLDARPFLTVITRTTGDRDTLIDTLRCLAAQTDNDFEVRLMANSPSADVGERVASVVATFHSSFASRVHLDVSAPHRVAPLNRALEQAAGRYVSVLDDDDLVFADWVEQFRATADARPGALVRCRAVDQHVDALDDTTVAVATDGFIAPYRATFDFAAHLLSGQSPPATWCCPLDVIDDIGLRFDEEMVVCEDIEFFLRLALVCGVADTSTFGMVYRRWQTRFSSSHTVDKAVWETALRQIVDRLDAMPMLLAEGTAQRLFQAAVQERQVHTVDAGTEALARRVDTAEHNWATLALKTSDLARLLAEMTADRDRWRAIAEQQPDSPLDRMRRWRPGQRGAPGGDSAHGSDG